MSDKRCTVFNYMAPASFRQNLNPPKIGPTLHSTILASGMVDLMFLTIILIPAFASRFYVSCLSPTLPLRSIADTSGSGYPEHRTDNASTSDHRQSASIIWEIPECFANCQGTETLLVFTRCQILFLRRSATCTHLSRFSWSQIMIRSIVTQ